MNIYNKIMIGIIDLNKIILIYLCKYLNISDKNKFKLVCKYIYDILKDDYTLTFKQERITKALLGLEPTCVVENDKARKLVYSVLSKNDGKTLSILTYLSIMSKKNHKCVIVTQRLLVNQWVQEHKKISSNQVIQPLTIYQHKKYSSKEYKGYDRQKDRFNSRDNADNANIIKDLELLTKNNIVIIDEETWHRLVILCDISYNADFIFIYDNLNPDWWSDRLSPTNANIILINTYERNIYDMYKKIDIDFIEEKDILSINVPSVDVININNQYDLSKYICNTINQYGGKILLVINNIDDKYIRKLNINKILENIVYIKKPYDYLSYNSVLPGKTIKKAFELNNGIICINFSVFFKLYNIKSFRKPSAIIYLNYNNSKQHYENEFSIIKSSNLVPFYYINLYKDKQINENVHKFLFEIARYEKSKFHPYQIFKIIKDIDEDIIKNMQLRLSALRILVDIINNEKFNNKKYNNITKFAENLIVNII